MIPVGYADIDVVSRLVIIPVGDAGGHDGSDGSVCQVSDFEVEPPAAFATLVTSGCSHRFCV
jgi:hypothetical protein